MSNVRSRSPRRKREYSFSSLSSGSFDNTRTPSYSQRPNKSNRNRNIGNRRRDRSLTRSVRRYSKERRIDEYNTSIENKQKQKEHEKHSGDNHYESPEEESYLVPTSHKNHNTRSIILEKNERHVGQEDTEESMRDPSTCNFRGILQMSEDEATNCEESVKIEERKSHKDETGDRLERLEKLVEFLATNNKKPQPVHTNTSQEGWSSNVDVFELIPRNSNFTTSMWLNKIQEECIERNLDEKTSIKFMQSKMTGVVKAWFKTISSYDFTWPELKMLITETFPDNIDFVSTLRLLLDRNKKPDETITQYYFGKMYLLEACKISGANAVSCLIDGLENEFQKQDAKSHNFLTPETLYSQFLSKYVDYDYDQYEQKPQEVAETYHFNDDNVGHKGESREGKFSNKYKQGFKKKKCLTCNKYGHFTTDCRHAPICYRCKKKGHIAVNCPLVIVH